MQGSFEDDAAPARAMEGVEAMLLAGRDGPDAWRAFDLAHITAAYSPPDREVSPTLAALLGREPRSLSDFLADHCAAFRPSAHS